MLSSSLVLYCPWELKLAGLPGPGLLLVQTAGLYRTDYLLQLADVGAHNIDEIDQTEDALG
jgi:hypothetical protein